MAAADQRFPRRERVTLSREVTGDELRELGTSGVLTDNKGRPKYDANQRRMSAVQARGLGTDHGVYHEMLRSDGAIAGVSALMRREVTRTHYRIASPRDATDLEAETAEFSRRFLGMDGTPGWLVGGLRRLLGHACQSFDYGFSALELAWDQRTWRGRPVWVPTRAEKRAAWSVEGWLWQGTDLVGMSQLVQTGATNLWGGGFSRVVIPANKLLLFTHDYVDGNPEGTSMLRPAWIYWKWKKDTIRRNQMAQERLFGGVTLLKEVGDSEGRPVDALEKKTEENMHAALAYLSRGALEFMTVPYGYEVDQKHPGFDIPNPVDQLMYCDRQIFLSLSAVLLGLDASHAGSKSLSQDLGGLLWKSLAAAADEIVDVINGIEGVETSGLLRKAVDANFGPLPENFRYPRLEHIGLEHQDVSALSDVLVKLRTAGMITKQREDEMFVRLVADLPDLVDQSEEATEDDPEIFGYHLTAGVVTINEARDNIGLDPIEGGERTVPELLAEVPTPGGAPEVIKEQEAATDA